MRGGRAPALSERPSKNRIHFGPHFASKGGFKNHALFWTPFWIHVWSSWAPLGDHMAPKGSQNESQKGTKEGPAGHVKSVIFDGRYFKIATTEGSQTRSF